MNFEPQKFFIGLMDFFSILLPGGLLTYFLRGDIGRFLWGSRDAMFKETEGWLIFLFASYLLGHFIFLLGSWFDELYDRARTYTLDWRIRQLAWNERLLPKVYRALLWMAFRGERNLAVDRAAKIKALYLDRLQAKSAVNTFQWAKARLAKDDEAALATVQRFEADSKFFRSLLVVLLLLPALIDKNRLAISLICLVFMLLALWRYAEQRLKATNQAYWAVITLEGASGTHTLERTDLKPGEPTQAGAVVYRQEGGAYKYLLVRSSKNPEEWVLPKGKIDFGEHTRETAVRELHEEAGVWARIVQPLDIVDLAVEGKQIKVQFYLMERLEEWKPRDAMREPIWLSLQDAVAKATFDDSKTLLNLADKKRDLL